MLKVSTIMAGSAGTAAVSAATGASENGASAAGAAETASEGSTTLYRGVAEGHHAFEDALEGVARRGDLLGHADPVLHNEGFTDNSRLTSWTTDPSVAADFAGKNGIILQTTLEELQGRGINFLTSPDAYGESEWLVEGRVDPLGWFRP
jgi:hypothetical protein